MATRKETRKAELLKEFEKMSTEQLAELFAFMEANEAGEIGDSEEDIRRFHEEYQNRRVQK